MSVSSASSRSALGRPWQLSLSPLQWRQAAALGQQSGLPLVVAQLLVSRGHTEWPAIEAFLQPRLEQLPDPSLLKDADRATALLVNAITQGHKIAIFGDYDVDGTCATAIVTRYLRALGTEPLIYIPDRLTEGYGPNPAAMEALHRQGAQVLLTVDTGTCAPESLNRAAALGLTVIVTDHHQPGSSSPADLPLYGSPTAAMVNPHRPDDLSDLTMLCGSGVVFLLLVSVNRALRQAGFFTARGVPEPKLTQLLDLVALATVADVMPLTGINRVLVARGLQQLASGQHRGLAALCHVAGVKMEDKGGLDTNTLGFHPGPRLNAAGRIDSARAALDLLLCDDDAQAQPLAKHLDDLNRQRREVEATVLAEALQQVENYDLEEEPLLVLHGDGWHPGVVGIVASRIKERTGRPVFVLGHVAAKDGAPGLLKGSGRGLTGLNLGAAVHACQAQLVSGGGHAMAAGISLTHAQLPGVRARLKAHMWEQINAHPAFAQPAQGPQLPLSLRLQSTLFIDAVMAPVAVTTRLCEALAQLAPYGQGHPEPLLGITGCTVLFCKAVGSTAEHLKLTLADAHGTRLDAICFGAAGTPLGQLLSQSAGKPLTVAGHLRSRTFNGRTYLDIQIRDAHPAWQPDAPAIPPVSSFSTTLFDAA